MRILSDKARRDLSLALFFAAFQFLWVTVLSLVTRAGEGWLTARQMELTYYGQQVLLIVTFLVFSILYDRLSSPCMRRGCAAGAAAVFFAGVAVVLAADRASLFYVLVSAVVLVCLGALAGAVYARMSRLTAAGAATARGMGLGSVLAIVLQYLLQSRWGQSPLLPVLCWRPLRCWPIGCCCARRNRRRPHRPNRSAASAC